MTEQTGIFGVWYGGSSYAMGEVLPNLEYFEDITEAKGALLDRYRHGHWSTQYFGYVNKDRENVLTPAVDEASTILIYLSEPTEEGAYPDRELSLMFDHDDEAIVMDSPV